MDEKSYVIMKKIYSRKLIFKSLIFILSKIDTTASRNKFYF